MKLTTSTIVAQRAGHKNAVYNTRLTLALKNRDTVRKTASIPRAFTYSSRAVKVATLISTATESLTARILSPRQASGMFYPQHPDTTDAQGATRATLLPHTAHTAQGHHQ